jgi:hypothetical protein
MIESINNCCSDLTCSDFLNVSGALLGALITGLTAVWIFRKGINEERKSKELEESVRLNDIEDLYFLLLENVSTGIKTQTELIDNYVNQINEDENKTIQIPKVINQDLNRIINLDSKDILKIYRNRNIRVEEYNKVFSNLDFILEIKNQIDNTYNKYLDKIVHYSELFTKYMNKILTLTSTYLAYEKIENPKTYKENPLWNFINDQILLYYKERDENNNIDYHYDAFIRPLNVGLVENFRKYRETVKITVLCKKANDSKFDYELNIKWLIDQIMTFNKDLKNSNKKITKHIEEYKKSR